MYAVLQQKLGPYMSPGAPPLQSPMPTITDVFSGFVTAYLDRKTRRELLPQLQPSSLRDESQPMFVNKKLLSIKSTPRNVTLFTRKKSRMARGVSPPRHPICCSHVRTTSTQKFAIKLLPLLREDWQRVL
jgi:hypothetical protein